VTGTGALVVAGALATTTVVRGPHALLLLVVGGGALLALVAGLVLRWSAMVALGIGLLGAQLAVRLALGPDEVDPWTPLYAGGLLLAAELAWWSLEPRVPAWSQPWLGSLRLASVLLACVCGTAASALVVLAAGAPLHGGIGLEFVGVAAAVLALAVIALVARTRVR
jgi:hypothetical protein